jgi:USP8 dimerisation domain
MSPGHPPNAHLIQAAVPNTIQYRPATIAELADKAREDIWDPNKHLKHWLRTAELSRKYGKQYAEDGDFERSFVQLARAATIILEKMPTHRDYTTLLNASQRHNLSLVSIPFTAFCFTALDLNGLVVHSIQSMLFRIIHTSSLTSFSHSMVRKPSIISVNLNLAWLNGMNAGCPETQNWRITLQSGLLSYSNLPYPPTNSTIHAAENLRKGEKSKGTKRSGAGKWRTLREGATKSNYVVRVHLVLCRTTI